MSQEFHVSGPAAIADQISSISLRPRPGRDDVGGYAIVGQPFESGDILCLRRFPVSTFGPGYVSVWHRSADGEWTIYTTVSPELSCPRFIAAAVSRVVQTNIAADWAGPSDLTVEVPESALRWLMRVSSTPATKMMNAIMSVMPSALFRSDPVLSAMSAMSTAMLGAGDLRLRGHMPNRQWFQAGPRQVWVVSQASATIGGRDLGGAAPLKTQALLGEVPMPQRGLLMAGAFSFEAYAPDRHLSPLVG
ncbi:MAG TPA: hypothetical protein PK286_03820 [Devosia sp.]|nr:hypothetical protein [Devosia sp.]